MRRLLRWAFNSAAAVSALLLCLYACFTTSAILRDSASDSHFFVGTTRTYSMDYYRGTETFQAVTFLSDENPYWRRASWASDVGRPHSLLIGTWSSGLTTYGGWPYESEKPVVVRMVTVPVWLPPLLLLVLPASWLTALLRPRFVRHAARRQLQRLGLCPACGYDHRATPDRCPECGADVAGNGSGGRA